MVSMLLGGNAQLKGFFRRQKIENTAIEVLYTRTKTADFYRKELKKQVYHTSNTALLARVTHG